MKLVHVLVGVLALVIVAGLISVVNYQKAATQNTVGSSEFMPSPQKSPYGPFLINSSNGLGWAFVLPPGTPVESVFDGRVTNSNYTSSARAPLNRSNGPVTNSTGSPAPAKNALVFVGSGVSSGNASGTITLVNDSRVSGRQTSKQSINSNVVVSVISSDGKWLFTYIVASNPRFKNYARGTKLAQGDMIFRAGSPLRINWKGMPENANLLVLVSKGPGFCLDSLGQKMVCPHVDPSVYFESK